MTPVSIIDVETSSLSQEELQPFMPEFQAPANYKDPEKIKASIVEQQARWLSEGALCAVTGRVLTIGILSAGEFFFPNDHFSEAETLEEFWKHAAEVLNAGGKIVGFFIRTFDFPFLIRRSFKHRVPVPMAIWNGRYLRDEIVDIADKWACGSRDPRDRISLDTLAKYLGIGAKNGDGKDFAALWASDKQKALAYLRNDLELTAKAYQALYL